MDVNWLRDLIEVAAHGSFSKAAIARSVSLSALSRRIQMLEAWAEHSLVDRSSHPVRLTSAGQDLLSVAQAVTAEVDRIRSRLRCVGERGAPIRFLAPNSVSVALLPRMLTTLQRALGPLQVHLMHGNYREVIQRFREGEAEFALYYVCSSFVPREEFSPSASALVAKDCLLPVAKDAKAASGDKTGQVRVVMLHDDSYLGQVARSIMLHYKLDYAISLSGSQILAVRQLAIEGAGLAWLPASLVAEDLAERRLMRVLDKIPPVSTDIYVTRQLAPLSADHELVWEKFRELARASGVMDFTKRIA
jgi:DNA-binding transcriptional LysR family regulator